MIRTDMALLAGATLLGAALAAAPAVNAPEGGADAAAVVDGVAITRAEHRRAVEALAKDKRNVVSQADAARILERLIEEELLVKRGLEIGLADRDRTVRGAIVAAMIRHATASASAASAPEEAMRAWYAENQGLFRPQPLIHAVVLAVPPGDAARMSSVKAAIARGDPLAAILSAHGGAPAPPLPDGPLPLAKLGDYLGGDIAAALRDAPSGRWSGPHAAGGQALFVAVKSRRDAPAPDFKAARPQIEAAYRRNRDDQAFRAYLDWLKARARISRSLP